MTTMGKAMVKGRGREERSKYHFSSIHDEWVNLDADSKAISGIFRGLPFYFLFRCLQQGTLPSIPLHSIRESLPFILAT